MNSTSLIGHVVELHAAVTGSAQPADAVVREFMRSRHYLGSRDRRFITEALFGMLRNYRMLDARVRAASTRISPGPLPSTSLTLYAAYVLSAGSQERSSLEADITPLWNTFLREVNPASVLLALSEVDPLADPAIAPAERLGLAHSFPEFIVREWLDRYGEAEAGALCTALNQPAPTTARVNTLKTTVAECLERLAAEGVAGKPTRISPAGIVLDRRVNIQALPSFKSGWFEMQDEGSQLIGFLASPPAGGIVVDACSGGGGKTLHLAALMENRGHLAAVEVSDRRLGDIRERIRRAGVDIVTLHSADRDGLESWQGTADVVLVDAPCTGTGTFRRNPGMKSRTTAEQRDALAGIQRQVLQRYADFVRPGGRLVYSTCSLLQKENESVVEEFLRSRPDFSIVPAAGLLHSLTILPEENGDFLHLFPHRHGTDGFFAAVVSRAR
jgi:16S rRNA (cytosine967-C5)-methyltransferase